MINPFLALKRFLLTILLISCCSSFAQISDIGGVDFTTAFNKKGAPDFSRYRAWFNYPIKLKKNDAYIVNGLRYSNIKLDFDKDYSFETTDLEEFHLLEYTLGYTYQMNEKWRLLAQISPLISSNLADKITRHDLTWSGGVLFMRKTEEPKETTLRLGLMYSQRAGIPFPLPIIAYSRKVNEHVKYTAGVPVSKIKYYFNKKHSTEAFVRLDGYYANLSEDILVGDNQVAENISMSAVVAGIGFDKYVGKRLNFFVKGGYTLRNSSRLVRNTNDRVFTFVDTPNAIMLRGGLKINF